MDLGGEQDPPWLLGTGSCQFRVKLRGAGFVFVTPWWDWSFLGKRKRAFYAVRKPGCSLTLSSGLVDSAGRCSPKITFAQERVSSPFALSWPGLIPGVVAAPGSRHGINVPVPTVSCGLSPGWRQQKPQGPVRGCAWFLCAGPARLRGHTGTVCWGCSVGTFPSPAFVFLEQTPLWRCLSDRAGVVGQKAPQQECCETPWLEGFVVDVSQKERDSGGFPGCSRGTSR